MDKEKEIEEMTSKIIGNPVGGFDFGTEQKVMGYITSKEIATILCNAGYGNVKQAVKEFAEELREKVKTIRPNSAHILTILDIDNLIKERFGEEE